MNPSPPTAPHPTAFPAVGTHDEVLSLNKHTRVMRRLLPGGEGPVLCKELIGPDAVERRRHEMRILERLAGANGVPQLVRVATSSNEIVMVDAGGMTLAQVMAMGPLPVPDVVALAQRLAHIVAGVHRRGVVHKDINPGNILVVGEDSAPLLIDFSIATTSAEERPGFAHHRKIVGTLAYIAPEQTGRTGRTVDQRADLYSLGASFYQLATGRTPFDIGDPLQLMHDQLARVAVPPTELNAEIPADLSAIIMRLLEKEPDRRYQSAEGLAYDLALLREQLRNGGGGPLVLGERDFPLQLSPPSRLVGREAEIGALRAAFEQAQARSCGVLITGSPGVGKTALIDELRPIVTERGGWFVAGKFDQYRQDLASDAVRQALRALGRLLLAEPEAELAALRTHILRSLGPNAGLLATMLPEFSLLLGLDAQVMTGDPLQAEGRLRQTALELLRAVASPTRPMVMVVDDLQWAAASQVGFIDAVLTDGEVQGLLLVGAYREAEVDATHPLTAMRSRWQRLGAAPKLLRLQNLPQAGLSALLEDMLRLQPAQAVKLAEAVGTRTGGNPYDTLELVNALRLDGALVASEEGWQWDAASIRRYVGQGEVVELLSMRIDRLEPATRSLLEIMACLGGEVELELLQAASGLTATALEEQLLPALEDGLLVMEHRGGSSIRFRHDRVQQAAYGRLKQERRQALHLRLARRLAAQPEFATGAAEQYLSAVEAVEDPEERRRVADLFRTAAANARLINHALTERLLQAAMGLLETVATPADKPLFIALETERHAALYNLARHEEADAVYISIGQRCGDPLDLAEATGVQMNSLCNRGRHPEAVGLGLQLLDRLGMAPPAPGADAGAEIARRLDGLCDWIAEDARADDLLRPETQDRRVLAAAKIANRMMAPAFFCAPTVMAWLIIESQALWAEHGPCAALVANVSPVGTLAVALRQDFRSGYTGSQRALAVGEARGYEPETSWARFCFVLFGAPWFERLEDVLIETMRAREGLLHGGDLQFACFTHYVSITALFDCAATLANCSADVDTALAFASRTGNDYIAAAYLAHRQLLRAMRGETAAPGSLNDASFDEVAHLAGLAAHPLAASMYHVNRALAALVFRDRAGLLSHASAAMPLLGHVQGFYHTALAQLLHAVALAEEARAAPSAQRGPLLAEIDECCAWLARRAIDVPANFFHLLRWVEAERAWAIGDFRAAATGFDAARRDAAQRHRPWHRALITERAAVFHLEHGLEHGGRQLLAEARLLYEAWGATAKVNELEHANPFLRADATLLRGHEGHHTSEVSADAIDLHAIVRASQALSSETDLGRLKARVVKLLGAMTGATTVLVALRDAAGTGWCLSESAAASAPIISVEEAGARGLLLLSAFRYAERTREPLLVEDATRDDRFARDTYLAGVERCSLMIVPILNQGTPRAVLVLENRLSSGAFSPDRLDAVMLIAGQLTVSLDNALLYASLERKVADRTEALAYSLSLVRATLESTADGILVADGRGRVSGFNDNFLKMWDIPRHIAEAESEQSMLDQALRQLLDPTQFVAKVEELYADPERESFDVLELKDGRVFERYSKPQHVGARSVGRVWSFRDITERRRAEGELALIHRQLLDLSRQAGMAEVATSVLHNVGNVLNSVNVSCLVISEKLRKSRVGAVTKAAELLAEHSGDLTGFLTTDPRGVELPAFLSKVAKSLAGEQSIVLHEVQSLGKNIEHIKEIVSMQQGYAQVGGVREILALPGLVEEALRMNAGTLARHEVELVRQFNDVPALPLEKHKVLQILVNLVRNAKHALTDSGRPDKRLTVGISGGPAGFVSIRVTDNGIGIPGENLTRIFAHGFTTKKNGHGFGLHSGALAAREMGGNLSVHSNGPGTGATFTLELPLTAQATA